MIFRQVWVLREDSSTQKQQELGFKRSELQNTLEIVKGIIILQTLQKQIANV